MARNVQKRVKPGAALSALEIAVGIAILALLLSGLVLVFVALGPKPH